MVSRRNALASLAAASGAVGLSGCTRVLSERAPREPDLGLDENPHDVPARQHAWNDSLREDEHGNHVPATHYRVALLSLRDSPSVDAARTVERAMRRVEAAHDWGPDGVLHTLAWGSEYFARVDALERSPVTHPRVLSRTDDPDLQRFDAALVLASDDADRLRRVERDQFTGGDDRLGAVFEREATRTGFIGEGAPASFADAAGVGDLPIPEDAPMFTGFHSMRRGTQATEDDVTIRDGEFAGGTTMHLSQIALDLERWYDFEDAERVARMFSPAFSTEDVAELADTVPFDDDVSASVAEHGVAGHHEKVARARRDGRPRLLRRDFDSADGGEPSVHFLSLQRTLSDFRHTRRAMNGWYLRDDHDDVTDREHNGLLSILRTTARANFYVPPRANRAFPLL
ncbi:DUF7405 family protein [Halobacterium yunchengense]|uniref:DUF7405 family protein n=1 Tax=Halobacterium yunchengense TaxID=3108497 RepID=UPI00300A3921